MRSSGYRDTAHAIAELIDNSVQAGDQLPSEMTEVEVICIDGNSGMVVGECLRSDAG